MIFRHKDQQGVRRVMAPRVAIVATALLLQPLNAAAQSQQSVPAPDRKYVLLEDAKPAKKARESAAKEVLASDSPANQDLDLKAPNVEYEKETNRVKASGGVIVSRGGVQAQADAADVNTETKDAALDGSVLISNPGGDISADSAQFNFELETGKFERAEFGIEEGGYLISADQAEKLSEFKYELENAALSTCHCADQSKPWQIHSSSASITQEGYAHCYNTWVDFHGVPIFYTPYLAFPTKQERTSGLLVPTFGYGSRDGIQYKQPIYIVPDDNSDLIFTPFTEMKTRHGMGFDFRRAFSRNNRASGRLIYSNEAPRDGDLRGTRIDNLFDPQIDTNRFGGFYSQLWRADAGAALPWTFVSDVHYASDDLFIREIEDDQIGELTSQYLTSTLSLRSALGSYLTADISAEYNQAMESDDDVLFQRIPAFRLSGLRSFRPFGFNPYGLKLVTRGTGTVTQFSRDEGYEGTRADLNPGVSLPFHLQNYMNGEFSLGARRTMYDLSATNQPHSIDAALDLEDQQERTVYNASYAMSTAVERVYDLDPDSWLSYVTNLGVETQENKLTRVKHVVEPFFRYDWVPPTSQNELPFFDSLDRIRQKSLFLYGVETNLYGRFIPTNSAVSQIPELSPRVEEMPLISSQDPWTDLAGTTDLGDLGAAISPRKGEIRPLTTLTLKQTYDYLEDQNRDSEDPAVNDPARTAFSDLSVDWTLYPSKYMALAIGSNIDIPNQDFSSWDQALFLRDDRGDSLRLRANFVERTFNQFEGNAELQLFERTKLGYYGRFDEREQRMIESKMLVRLISGCNCWHLDLGYHDRYNPDKQNFFMSFTFTGLGDITQQFAYGNEKSSSGSSGG